VGPPIPASTSTHCAAFSAVRSSACGGVPSPAAGHRPARLAFVHSRYSVEVPIYHLLHWTEMWTCLCSQRVEMTTMRTMCPTAPCHRRPHKKRYVWLSALAALKRTPCGVSHANVSQLLLSDTSSTLLTSSPTVMPDQRSCTAGTAPCDGRHMTPAWPPAGAAHDGAVRSAGLQQGAAVAAAQADHDAGGVPGGC
jgi:hypothetical protein